MWWIDRHTERRRNNNIVCSIDTNTHANASMHTYTHPITVAMCACKTLPLSSLTCAWVCASIAYDFLTHINAHTRSSLLGIRLLQLIDIYHRANTHTHTNGSVCVCFQNEKETHNSGHTSTKRHTPWATNIRKHFFLFTSFVRMRHERSSRSLVWLVKINKQLIKFDGGAKIWKQNWKQHQIFEFCLQMENSVWIIADTEFCILASRFEYFSWTKRRQIGRLKK